MKVLITTLISIFLLPNLVLSQSNNDGLLDSLSAELQGTWSIDLRPTPDAEPYFQAFTINSIQGKDFKGTFYGSSIKDAIFNEEWGKIYFAFYSSDEHNNYYHSGSYENGKLIGITYCPTRDFITPWVGIHD